MNPMNMGGMNPGNPAMGGGMPMMNNGANGIQIRQPDEPEEPLNYEARLNTYIYSYFLKKKNFDMARALKNSQEQFDPPLVPIEGATNGADNEDTKDGVNIQRPDDLPVVADDSQSTFLLAWFSMFWDIWMAQRKNPRASQNAAQFVALSQQHGRQREQQQQQMMRQMPNMMPGMEYSQAQMMQQRQNQLMRMTNGDMRRGVLQNNQIQPTPQQVAHFQQNMRAQQQQQQHIMNVNQMRRDPSGMNGEGPRTPGGGDHAPSPSKRARLDGVPFGNSQMMPNGRPMPPGMPGQQQLMQPNETQSMHAQRLLMTNGINPGNLSETQFASFQSQDPNVQQKSIQVYAQNMTKHQGDRMKNAGGMSDGGSPIMAPGMELSATDQFFATNPGAAQQMRNVGMLPNGQPNNNGSNHALQDYQMQLMLLEQQNKKRLLMARQEQDTITRPEGQPGMPGQAGFGAPGMSPQGSRGGPSPQPGDPARRGTPKLGQPGIPGSPMPDGRLGGSPAVMNNFNGMDPAMYGQVNGRMQPPPNSNPAFNGGQIPPQQMEAMQRAQAGNRMPNGQWQQGPQGHAPMMQGGQPGQPAQMGTPQQRNDMPPPQGVPAAAATNGRPSSPAAAPPTPQTTNKANPKGKKDGKPKKPAKKNSTASVAATPAADGENPPATPTPSTPITTQHQNSFAKNDASGQATTMPNANGAVQPPVAPQADPNNAPPFGAMDGTDTGDFGSMPFNDLNDPNNLLENFDFEQFLQGDAFNFEAGAFDTDAGIETAGMENV